MMAPIVKTLPFYIKDSQHALENFRDFNFFGRNKLISLWILHLWILFEVVTTEWKAEWKATECEY